MGEIIRIPRNAVQSSDGPTRFGIAYQRPPLTGQKISYRDGDDGYHLINGTFNYIPPLYPVSYARLDYTSLSPFTTLVDNNSFGNKDRFTALDGSQTITDNIVFDNLTGLYWDIIIKPVAIWDDAIDNAVNSVSGGFTDWRLANRNELQSIMDYSLIDKANYIPLNMSSDFTYVSTTVSNNTAQAYYTSGSKTGNIQSIAKTASLFSIYCRNHF